jgi:iron complex transport system substrate-binding protein
MKHPSPSIPLVVLWLAAMALAACGGAPAGQPPEPAGTLTVVDALGRSVEFPGPPQRIVVAGKSSLTTVETLYLFAEAKDRIVGVSIGQQDPGDFLVLADPAFEDKARLQPDAGPEQIAPLNPDAVILRSFMAESLGSALEQLDLPVVYVDLETPEQVFRDLVTLGQLFDNEARAQEIRVFYQARLDRVDEKLQGLPDEQRPSTLLLQYSDQGGDVALNVPSASWLQTTEVELAGGRPVWKEAALGGGWTVVNFEQIAAWNPEQIFVIDYKGDSAETVGRLKADPRWQELQAVQEGQIFGFAADIFSWDQPEPRWILGVTWLAGKLHPGRFDDLDMMQEVSQFFGQMYGLDEAVIQAEIVPALKGDVP